MTIYLLHLITFINILKNADILCLLYKNLVSLYDKILTIILSKRDVLKTIIFRFVQKPYLTIIYKKCNHV